jgi:hypothetical protein
MDHGYNGLNGSTRITTGAFFLIRENPLNPLDP